MKGKPYLKISIAALLIVGYLLFWYNKCRLEAKHDLHFVITKIHEHSTSAVDLSSKEKKYKFWGYQLSRYDSLRVGDSVAKEPYQPVIYFFRKKAGGEYVLFAEETPNSLMIFDHFYK